MSATTTEGTGPGSVYNVKPPIINGVVKNVNLSVGKSAGEVVNTVFYTFPEDGVVTNNSNTPTAFADVTYEPMLESSLILVEFHAQYTVNGGGDDDFRSSITVNDMEITWRDQVWVDSQGGGTRGAVLFPISMVYDNVDEERSLEIKVLANRNGSDDTLSVDKSSAYLKITEVAK